ncbi:hypothetical protein NKR19_g4871 [Coniochaeta hoffmannii]|uniref:Uncharacterized protein n=1 Tax=Coniochaeta hoffmannii TaxID=91930 RepID=A0AA38VUJ4_9PEZI|nr:hypothetical protein NKR19_g4871 [Coniochaeta hoffmannii]
MDRLGVIFDNLNNKMIKGNLKIPLTRRRNHAWLACRRRGDGVAGRADVRCSGSAAGQDGTYLLTGVVISESASQDVPWLHNGHVCIAWLKPSGTASTVRLFPPPLPLRPALHAAKALDADTGEPETVKPTPSSTSSRRASLQLPLEDDALKSQLEESDTKSSTLSLEKAAQIPLSGALTVERDNLQSELVALQTKTAELESSVESLKTFEATAQSGLSTPKSQLTGLSTVNAKLKAPPTDFEAAKLPALTAQISDLEAQIADLTATAAQFPYLTLLEHNSLLTFNLSALQAQLGAAHQQAEQYAAASCAATLAHASFADSDSSSDLSFALLRAKVNTDRVPFAELVEALWRSVLSERGFAEDPALPTTKDIVRLRKLYEEEKETKEATILAVARAEKSSATTADEPWPPATEKPSGITVEKETFAADYDAARREHFASLLRRLNQVAPLLREVELAELPGDMASMRTRFHAQCPDQDQLEDGGTLSDHNIQCSGCAAVCRIS